MRKSKRLEQRMYTVYQRWVRQGRFRSAANLINKWRRYRRLRFGA